MYTIFATVHKITLNEIKNSRQDTQYVDRVDRVDEPSLLIVVVGAHHTAFGSHWRREHPHSPRVVVVVVGVLSFLGNRPQARPAYNAANETRIDGSVLEVQESFCPVTEDGSSHLIVKTDSGPVVVHVGIARTLRANHIASPLETWWRWWDRSCVTGERTR